MPFAEVSARLVVARGIPGRGDGGAEDPAAALLATVQAAAHAYAAQFAMERHRIWLLHAVTAPAAAALLVPLVAKATAGRLVAAAQQSVCAWFAALGAPAHTPKLVEALRRAEDGQSPQLRGMAHAWLAWR